MMKTIRHIWMMVAFMVLLLPLSARAYTNATPAEAKAMIDSMPNLKIVDVRERSEFCLSGFETEQEQEETDEGG